MATKNDKWVMFRNYMANELGITKEDVREWIMDAVHQEVEQVVNNAYRKCDLENFIKKEIYDWNGWGKNFKDVIRQEVGKQLAERITIQIK
jgi:predicted transcriptional regulator